MVGFLSKRSGMEQIQYKVGNTNLVIMQYINNLPVIMSAFSGIMIGIFGYVNNLPNITIYKNMCLFIIVFYFIGVMIKWTIIGFLKENEEAEKTSIEEGITYIDEIDGDDSIVGMDADEKQTELETELETELKTELETEVEDDLKMADGSEESEINENSDLEDQQIYSGEERADFIGQDGFREEYPNLNDVDPEPLS